MTTLTTTMHAREELLAALAHLDVALHLQQQPEVLALPVLQGLNAALRHQNCAANATIAAGRAYVDMLQQSQAGTVLA